MLQTARDFQYMTLRKCWTRLDLPPFASMFAAPAVQTTFLTVLQFNKLRKRLSWPIFLFLSVSINRFQNNIMKHVRTYKFPLYHFQVMATFLTDPAQKNLQSRYFFQDATTPGGPGSPDCQGFTITHTPHSVGLLWTSDQPDTETSTWQHTTLTTEQHQCPRPDSNPQSQQDSVRRSTP
jgi:hypothetical protein